MNGKELLHSSYSLKPVVNICYLSALTAVKRTATILVLCCLLIYMGGYQLIMFGYQLGSKAEMKAWLRQNRESEYNTVLSFTAANGAIADPSLTWEEEGEEFVYKGSMYDVVSIEYANGKATVYCVNDEEENKLSKLSEELRQKHSKESTGAKSIFRKILITAFDLQEESSLSVPLVDPKIRLVQQQRHWINPVADILSPPPEYGCIL